MTDSANTDLQFRPLAAADLPAAADLSKRVGWPHRLEDWRFLAGTAVSLAVEAEGTLIGTAMGWHLGPGHFSVGMVIVDPDRQGGGIGRRLMDAILAEAQGRVVILNATDAGIGLYERLGFARAGRVQQHQGMATAPALPALGRDVRLRPVTAADADAIAALDRQATGLDRTAILRALATVGDAVLLEHGGRPVGFAFCRHFGRGQLVGPVIAPTLDAAKRLIGYWLSSRAGSFVRADVPEDSGLPEWLATLGLAPVAPVVPMVRGAAPAPKGPARVFGLIAQAIG